MGTYEDLTEMLMHTESMVRIKATLEQEPVMILCDICSQYEKNSVPVTHEDVHSSGFIRDLSLKTLMSAELIKREPSGQKSLFCYRPTSNGMKYYRKLLEEGYVSFAMNKDSGLVSLEGRPARAQSLCS